MKPVVSIAAAAEQEQWYAGFAAGLHQPDTSTDRVRKNLDSGPAGDLRLGARLLANLALEAAIGGWHVEGDSPATDTSETFIHGVSATFVLVTVKGSVRMGSDRLRAFAGVGGGYYRFDVNLKDPPSVQRRASVSDQGGHLVAGIEGDLTSRFGLGVEYRWVRAPGSSPFTPDRDDLGGGAVLLSAVRRF